VRAMQTFKRIAVLVVPAALFLTAFAGGWHP